MKFWENRILYALFFIAGFAPLFGQIDRFQFEQLSSNLSIPNKTINTIIQDHHGFLWIGTWSGLFRYDGNNLKSFRQSDLGVGQLKSNKITCIFEDSKQRLWIGTRSSGFYLYEATKDEFVQFTAQDQPVNSLSNDNVWAIHEDKEGFIWIGTESGLNRFDPEHASYQQFLAKPGATNSLSNSFVYSIDQSADGSLWVGTENGLNRLIFDEQLEDYLIYNYSLSEEQESPDYKSPMLDDYIYEIRSSKFKRNTLWVGTKSGLKQIQFKALSISSQIDIQHFRNDNKSATSLSNNFVTDIVETDADNLWIATFNGLNVLKTKENKLKQFFARPTIPASLNNNTIKSLYFDRTSILWVGTEKGINKLKLNKKPFSNFQLDQYKNSNNNVVVALECGRKDNITWAGTRGGGLNKITLSRGLAQSPIIQPYTFKGAQSEELTKFISELLLDQEGDLWIATQGAGLISIDEEQLASPIPDFAQFTKGLNPDNTSDDYIMSMEETSSGNLWIGHWDGGLDYYQKEQSRFISFSETAEGQLLLTQFPNVALQSTIHNGQEYLWVGTRGNGLYQLQLTPQTQQLHLIKHYKMDTDGENHLSNNFINIIYVDHNNGLWIGTENGLNYLAEGQSQFITYNENNGLADRIIQDIIQDPSGKIWISTQNGISSLQLNAGEINVQNFGEANGLPNNFFNSKASCVSQSGNLLFGGANGISLITPDQINLDTVPPKVVFTDLKVVNKSVPIGEMENGRTILEKSIMETSKIQLHHNENILSLEVAMLHFSYPSKNKFAYQLEGFDEEWIDALPGQRFIQYTNLPYNEFTLKVKAANGDGIWSTPIALSIEVKPPFWLTDLAFFLYFLLFIGLLFGVRYLTLMRANLNNKIKIEQLEKQKLKEVNEVKLKFFTNISHELRTPLTLIMSPLEQLIKEHVGNKKTKHVYLQMFNSANKLLHMINQLLDIRKSEAGLFKLEVAKGNIVKFISEVVLSFRGLAQNKDIQLIFLPPQDAILVWYDRDQMEKVLFNLLSNAIKFTPSGGRIEIKLIEDTDQQQLTISVEDNGTGISPTHLPHIFNRFYQIEKGPKNTVAGTGIGLALVKNIIEAHKGEISVDSQKGSGTRFDIKLKLGDHHFAADEIIQNFRNSEHPSHYALPYEEVAPSALPIQNKSQKTPYNLLLVEDNADIRTYLRENLSSKYNILEAEDGEAGLAIAIKEAPDLIISDIAMPKMDGLEMCQKLKSNIITSHIPIILLTARTSLIFKIDGYETGADDYITKPFNMKLLSTRIENLLAIRKRLWKKFSEQLHVQPSDINISSLDEEFLKKAINFVEVHMDDFELSVEKLAQEMHMSRMQLYRKIKNLTNNNPNTFIRNIRLKRAAQLLEAKRYTIAEVTYKVGFQDLKYFRERFKKEFGLSPSEYIAKKTAEKEN